MRAGFRIMSLNRVVAKPPSRAIPAACIKWEHVTQPSIMYVVSFVVMFLALSRNVRCATSFSRPSNNPLPIKHVWMCLFYEISSYWSPLYNMSHFAQKYSVPIVGIAELQHTCTKITQFGLIFNGSHLHLIKQYKQSTYNLLSRQIFMQKHVHRESRYSVTCREQVGYQVTTVVVSPTNTQWPHSSWCPWKFSQCL